MRGEAPSRFTLSYLDVDPDVDVVVVVVEGETSTAGTTAGCRAKGA